jgi:hypothetical protein
MRPDDIKDIKIFENYSFVDVPLDSASKAISKLSGKTLRGRKIMVNLARKKNNQS